MQSLYSEVNQIW